MEKSQREINKAWRNAAREALRESRPWEPTHLSHYTAVVKAQYYATKKVG